MLYKHLVKTFVYYPAEKNFEDYCEPFIGKLPSNLKLIFDIA